MAYKKLAFNHPSATQAAKLVITPEKADTLALVWQYQGNVISIGRASALIVLFDRNKNGCSTTNAINSILDVLDEVLLETGIRRGIEAADIVQVDSDGKVDLVEAKRGASYVAAGWKPLGGRTIKDLRAFIMEKPWDVTPEDESDVAGYYSDIHGEGVTV